MTLEVERSWTSPPHADLEYAAADGIVMEAGPASGFGNVSYLVRKIGEVLTYQHMEKVLVKEGSLSGPAM